MRALTLSLLLFMLVLAGCVYQEPSQEQSPPQNQGNQQSLEEQIEEQNQQNEENGIEGMGGNGENNEEVVREIRITARQWEFDPNVIRVKKGERIKLIITSEDVAHGLAFPDYGINREIAPGEEVVIEFVADKGGEFQGFCSIYCGEGHSSMRLTLIVEEN